MAGNDAVLNDLIVRFALIERLVYNVTGSLIGESDDPAMVLGNVVEQLRAQFDPETATSADMREFLERATRQIENVERQLTEVAIPFAEH
ncbi:hypothetical protein [uncultured Roseibium sp.]|uniref:hypothetical protein n=1 Tax=uncultured Roseibium sp. TaxID=1936171 RepID=UPI0026368D1B|nr:hypothetical protein [uncultured Roseibium sp.]